jgi:hypothetical protein
MTTPVESTADLAAQQRIKFGTLRNGSTMDFFRESKIPTISKMSVDSLFITKLHIILSLQFSGGQL